jgi:segregation and condensation protein A
MEAPEMQQPVAEQLEVELPDSNRPTADRPESRVQNPERFTGHRVRLAVYEGPLDLLLYLVRAHRTDICDIPISQITSEFVQFIALMDELDLDYAGDFLVTAATLMQIKARMLLPQYESANEDELQDDSEGDPRAALVERLLELQKYQGAAEVLREKRDERAHIFARPAVLDPGVAAAQKAALGDGPPEADMGVMLKDVSTFDLLRALQKVLDRQNTQPVTTIRREPFTLAERVQVVARRIKAAQGGATFGELCDDCQSRLEVVITFLSILELIARKRIAASQPEPFGEIWLQIKDEL